MRPIRSFPAVLLLLAAAAPARAQVVVGRLVDGSAERPVAEAFVQLIDTSGERIAGALTDSTGRFVLRARQPGDYRLRAERLGYESVTSELITLGRSTIQYEFMLHPRALVLPALSARSDDRGCERRPDGPAVYALWEAVRSALNVASWTGATESLRFSMINHVRELNGSLEEVRGVQLTPYYTTAAMPYRAFDAEYLAREGYMTRGDDGESYLLGPDTDVLLSESFLDSHCFRIVTAEDTSLIGLGFEPLRNDGRTDVSGVLWVERSTAQLRYLAYRFENLPRHLRRYPPSGEVHFRRFDSGLWIVDRWWIRAPRLAAGRFGSVQLEGYREDGGTVISAATIDRQRYQHRGSAVIDGVVIDSTTSVPLDNALVYLRNTPFFTTTNATGRFVLRGVPPGRYTIGITHALLEDVGVSLPVDTITVMPGDTALHHVFRAPSRADMLRSACPAQQPETTTGLVYGVVRNATSARPVAGVTVRASWKGPPPEGGRDTNRELTAVTSSDGRYFFCWLPAGREIELRVDSRDIRHRRVKLELADVAGTLRHDFE